ncbi:ABC transporter substrate-binding protein [Paenibacillus mendelii]|uniref:ABC transporter substrate-binding protein n=1 Tax=Paenibacillus mendelii TaxID=206163 RepID=A0ABV6JFG1_9BACL|nr:extracellular solute-binding protein [Paenibacillus mendelii]MCQ6557525.1 extracellular solute-binding protein [Paenibacillus mendelii]
MHKSKAILFLVLFVLLVVSACSNNTPNPTTDTPANKPTTENTDKENPVKEEPPSEEPVLDMKGEPIKIMLWYGEPVAGTEEGDLVIARQKEIEKKYNTTIEWVKVPWGEPIQMITAAALSGTPVADIVALDRYHAIPAINQGLVQPIDDYFDFADTKWPKGIKDFGSWNGKMYGFTERVTGSAGLYYNKTLFEREGLPDPHDLIAEDKWTWDTFLDIAKKATKDTNGDGVTDQWGLANEAGTLARIMVYANNGSMMEQKDGKWVFPAEDPNMIEALRFMGDMFTTHKVIAPNDGNDDYNESQTLFSSGKAAMVTGELWEGAERKTMTDEQGFVYFPKGPKASEYVNNVANFIMWYMPANATKPKEAATIWQDLILWDRIDKLKREDAEKQNLASEQDIEMMMKITDIVQPVFLPLGGLFGEITNSIAIKGESPETVLQRSKQTAQEGLDTNLNTAAAK